MSESDLPLRASCRGLVFDDDSRVLLAQHRIDEETTVWVGPGGGVEDGESLVEALARELFEETGLVLTDQTAPALVWAQENRFPEMEPHGYSGVTGHFYVVPLSAFTREAGALVDAADHPCEDGVLDMRWWSLDDVEAAQRQAVLFGPRAFPRLMRDLLDPDGFEAMRRAPLLLGL
ncbi:MULTISPECIES: NUDIX domain-containing protein [Nocardioides]|uniref:NUDIX domain-containing protein n=1 Tax=Nocardioides TaxID=1839 RepID=UPI000A009140|nr:MULTISPECIES: NUDIX hydrolase [Nocardioides]